MKRLLCLILVIITFPCFGQNIFDKYNNPNVGTKAQDFVFYKIDEPKIEHNLYEIKSYYTMLLFYNPDCEHCLKKIKQMKNNDTINHLIEVDSLIVIAIPPEVDKQTIEQSHCSLPKKWISACCDEKNYNIITSKYIWKVPEVFVLDINKRVIKVEIENDEQ